MINYINSRTDPVETWEIVVDGVRPGTATLDRETGRP